MSGFNGLTDNQLREFLNTYNHCIYQQFDLDFSRIEKLTSQALRQRNTLAYKLLNPERQKQEMK